jgi:hypothetical protein
MTRRIGFDRAVSSVILGAFLAGAFAGCVEEKPAANDIPKLADAADDAGDAGGGDVLLPPGLPFELTRSDPGEPVDPGEVRAFSVRLGGFLREHDWFGWVARTVHGVDASTGKPDFAMWWTDIDIVRDGDTVTFRHMDLGDRGGHNMLGPTTEVLGAALAGVQLTDDPALADLAARLCRGIGAQMLGMVHDADDPLPHLMARNIVPFNHAYLTRDQRHKVIDYSGWFRPYDRWNCSRFLYPDNPYWGPVWVTNVRSKDDVGHLFRIADAIEQAGSSAFSAEVRDACGEAAVLLSAFAGDIVESGYAIRTKDAEGRPHVFSQVEHPGIDRVSTDLDNFVAFEGLWPGTECNAMRAADLLGPGDPSRNDCGSGAPNVLERVSLQNNYPNINFFRAYHQANVALSLAREDFEGARRVLGGLIDRLEEEATMDRTGVTVPGDRWDADLALGLVHAAVVGMPLTADEVRRVLAYYGRSLDRLEDWGLWDPWAEGVSEGVHDPVPPRFSTEDDGASLYWIPAVALAAPLEYCASRWRNPAGTPFVDCDALLEAWRNPED